MKLRYYSDTDSLYIHLDLSGLDVGSVPVETVGARPR
jgi:uncharacterized protein YuzE